MLRSRAFAVVGGTVAALALAGGLASVVVSCQSTPTTVPLRTFERPQKVALVCLNIYDADTKVLATPVPLPVEACPPVPFNTDATLFHNHLYAMVTQQTRGQLAVVDLTQGIVVDEDRSTPGVNFIPVGGEPTDVAVAPDATMAFVSAGEPNGQAIYGIPTAGILGDSLGPTPPLRLTDLPTCRLPQRPQALGVARLTSPGPGMPSYVVVALLSASNGGSARIVTIDPRPFSGSSGDAGGPPALIPGVLAACTILGQTVFTPGVPNVQASTVTWPDGVPFADAGDPPSDYPSLSPSCGASTGGGGSPLPAGGDAGGEDGGDAAIGDGGGDAATGDGGDDGGGDDGGGAAGVDAAISLGSDASAYTGPSANLPLPMTLVVRDDAPVAYVGDGALPLVHVIAFDGTANPSEATQYVATSVVNPSRTTTIGAIALSPPTSDRRRYLYAVDKFDGTIVVFDATAPVPSPAPGTPLLRPHAALDPFMAPDRIALSAPVTSLTFATHDWPLVPPQVCTNGSGCVTNPNLNNAFTGLLCNPNPNAIADAGTGFIDAGLGGYYRADFTSTIQPQGSGIPGFPTRLRGVFAFATLSNGNLITVDVDDWDAPCRRPDPMQVPDPGFPVAGSTGQLDLPEPAASGPDDLDPYHAPQTAQRNANSGATQESFFPVSAPNRLRSSAILRNDPTVGNHQPNVTATPQLFGSTGAPFSSANGAPLILPTALEPGRIDPTFIVNATSPTGQYTATPPELESSINQNSASITPGDGVQPRVRVSFDDPTAHIDQDWTVSYEGVLPLTNGLVANVSSSDNYQSLTLAPGAVPDDASASNGAQFCARGIEDWSIGQVRAAQVASAMAGVGLTTDNVRGAWIAQRGSWTSDYVEITDDLLGPTDGYWALSNTTEDCWDGVVDGDAGASASSVASTRYNYCLQVFGTQANADSTYSRDFPIVRATDNALTLGRFGWPDGTQQQTASRTVVGADPSNQFFLKRAACCFHKQVTFKVRAGGEWVTVGQNGLGMLHHVRKDPATGACVLPCEDQRLALMNARTFDVPPSSCTQIGLPGGNSPIIPRNSPLAMRNPMFSFVLWTGCPATAFDTAAGVHTSSQRDSQWRFTLRGGFAPQTVNLGGTSAVPVAPQSMLYVGPFGQLAVVDGAQQGLIMIDLNTLAFAHTPYF